MECFGAVFVLFPQRCCICAEHRRRLCSGELEESMVTGLVCVCAYRRFFLDGWLNILYLVVFATIVYIIRPTANNKRFAMSEEVPYSLKELYLTN